MPEQTIALLAALHEALDNCARIADPATARLLSVLRDMTSETSNISLKEACEILRHGRGSFEEAKATNGTTSNRCLVEEGNYYNT